MFRSKETVGCFYCEWTGRRDKLIPHSNTHHPGFKVRVRIDANALSTLWKQQSVPLVTDETANLTNVNNANDDSPTFDQTQLTTTSIVVTPVITSAVATPVATSAVFTPVATSAVSTPVATSSVATPVTTPTIPFSFSPSNEHQLQQQLFHMSAQLLDLSTKFDSLLVTKSSSSTTKEANEGEDLDVLFNEIKSSDDLWEMKNFEINLQMELITCLPCLKYKTHAPKQLQSTIKSSFGVFNFVEQDANFGQTQKFRDLKKSIRYHLSSNLHVWCSKEGQRKKEEADDLMRKNEKAGYNIGRIALFCNCTGLGGLKFVEAINLADLCGSVVGNYRHSRYIYDRLRDVMAEEMKSKIAEYLIRVDPVLQHPVPFGITFDKVTLLKRSVQTTLLITFVDGVLTPIYLQSPLCRAELGGKELAENCIHVMNSFGLTKEILQQQLSGCAVDGAYIHLSIDKHLSSALEMNSEWLTTSWDCGHLLELAINDVKRQRKFVWINNFIKLCAALMKKFSYGKQYEILLETAQYLGEDILAPKQFHTTRFVSSERRVYETILRDWRSMHEVQEEEDQLNALSHGDVSTRTRRAHTVSHEGAGDMILKLDDISSIDFVGKLLGLNDIYSLLVKSSMSIQMVNNFPWEYTCALEKLKKSLCVYAEEVEKLSDNLNNTQEMEDLDEIPPTTRKVFLDKETEAEEGDFLQGENEESDKATLTSKHLSLNYNDLLRGEFQGRPVIRKAAEHDLDDPTFYLREKLVDFCRALCASIDTRFKEAPAIFKIMANCLDVAALYQEVILDERVDVLQYGQSSFQTLLDFTKNSSKHIKIDNTLLNGQYLEWKERCLSELKDKENWNVWTKDDKIATTKVMKAFFTNEKLANGIEQFLYFYCLMVVKIRSEAVCESAASILKQHIQGNRALDHESLDKEVMLHWNAPPLHLADPFIKSCLDNYFFQLKNKDWIFFKKSEQHRLFRLVSPGSVVLNRLRKEQLQRIPIFASANRAYLLVDKNKADTNYKITAKKYLLETQQQIERYILPQLLSMQVKSNSESNEFVFDDLAMQIETKMDILNHYHNHVKQAISVIESSQKLIDIHSKHENTVNIGRKLYRDEGKEYLKKYWNTIELIFHNLTVTEDMTFKTDQAIQILDLLPTKYDGHVSMNYFDMNLEVIEHVTSKANLLNVCLNIQSLNIDDVHDIIVGEELVTLSIEASSEQYQRAIQNSKLNVILVEMDSHRQYLSADQALAYVKNEANNIKSISFDCVNQTTVNTIVTGLEKIAISLTFTKILIARMKDVCQKLSKPYTVQLINLSISKAKICINETKERNFTMSLCDLKADDAWTILKKFDRNEQDINSSLKSIAEQYMKAEQSHEELSAYRNMGVTQFIIVQELNPRPWISICVTAGLGVLQIAGGVCLAAATCGLGVQLGIGLITEGVSDIYYAVKGAISRNFSWKDYAIQKGISLALCFVTLGCSAVSQAAKAAQTTAKGGVEFMKQTLRGTGTIIKNSARTLTTGAIKGTATTSFTLAVKQVGVVCLETGVRELANYSTDLAVQSILSPMKSVVGEEIACITNAEREKEYYDRVLCRALNIDAYYGNDNFRQKLEETAVKILTKENSALVSAAKSLGSGISGAVIRHAQSFSKETSGNTYLKLGQQLLTVMPALKGCEEITKITGKFFDSFKQELSQLEQKMPTFDQFLRESDPSMSQQTATEIRQLLERHDILNQNGTVNIQLTDLEDAPDFSSHHASTSTKTNASPRNRNEKLAKSLQDVKFSDEKHKSLTIQVLNKYRAIDPRSLKAGKLQKKIIDILTDQVMAIIQGAVVGPLANCFVGSAINALSQKIQLKLDSNGTIHDQLMQEGAQRYIANLSNDFYRDVQSGKIQLPPDTEKKLNDLIEKSKDPNFKPQNAVEELAVSIANNKQGGVIEIGILAAMTGKSISVIQSEQTGESGAADTDVTMDYSAPQIDKQGNFQDGHYESTDGNATNAGPNDCLYASVIGKTSNTFKDTQDMRIKCAAFVLANPTYILSLQPAINIINGCSNPIRRKQLLMEGGNPRQILYPDGTYGARRRESRRLKSTRNVDINRGTHESEHPIPFNVLTSEMDEKSRTKRKSAAGRKLEAMAPAYHEREEAHREHIGTGYTNDRDASGMNSGEYRDAIKQQFIDNRDPGTAIQLNQLNYAFQDDFQQKSQTPDGQVAHDSFLYMLQNTLRIPYYTSDGSLDYIPFTPVQKAEAYLARWAAETGKYPSTEMHKTVGKLFNVK